MLTYIGSREPVQRNLLVPLTGDRQAAMKLSLPSDKPSLAGPDAGILPGDRMWQS